jgi:hypothetical protein
VPLEQNVSLILFKLCYWERIIKVLLRKAKSFVCMEDVHSVEDLKKPKHPHAKKNEETIS